MRIRQMKIYYQYRHSRACGGSGIGSLSRDLATVPKIVIANHFLKNIGFNIGDKVEVQYQENKIIIHKLT